MVTQPVFMRLPEATTKFWLQQTQLPLHGILKEQTISRRRQPIDGTALAGILVRAFFYAEPHLKTYSQAYISV